MWQNYSPPRVLAIGVLLGAKSLLQPITSAQSNKQGLVPCFPCDLGDFSSETKSVLEGTTVLVGSLV